MPRRKLESCQACLTIDVKLVTHEPYGRLCHSCNLIAIDMEDLISRFESCRDAKASNRLRSQISRQLKELALQLQRRMQGNDKPGVSNRI
jgi:hypothetical protein